MTENWKDEEEYKYYQFPGFIRNRMQRMDANSQSQEIRRLKQKWSGYYETRTQNKERLKAQMKQTQATIDKLKHDFPKYSNKKFEEMRGKVQECLISYFTKGISIPSAYYGSQRRSIEGYVKNYSLCKSYSFH